MISSNGPYWCAIKTVLASIAEKRSASVCFVDVASAEACNSRNFPFLNSITAKPGESERSKPRYRVSFQPLSCFQFEINRCCEKEYCVKHFVTGYRKNCSEDSDDFAYFKKRLEFRFKIAQVLTRSFGT